MSDKISKRAIQAQLKTILDSSDFTASERFRQFLKFVVEETLAGNQHELKAYTIATQVFGRSKHFDPMFDPVVRVEATKLRNKLEQFYLRRQGQGRDKIFISIPKGTYVPVFELIPGSGGNAGCGGNTGQAVKNAGDSVFFQEKPTILILPFAPPGGADSSAPGASLARELTEEIAMGLSRFDDLTIINPQQIPDHQYIEPSWDMATKLGARFIIYGSVQMIDSRVRARVSLVDARSKSSLWGEKYDRAYDPAMQFSILDDIASQVVISVGDGFGFINRFLAKEQAGKPVADLKVHETVLRYHHWVNTLNMDLGKETINALERAIELDPGYALTKAMLADVLAGHYQWGYEADATWLERSRTLAMEAMDMEGSSQYVAWAWCFNLYLSGDREQLLQAGRRAVELNPYNTNIVSVIGFKFCMVGHWDEGLTLLARSTQISRGLPGWIYIANILRNYLDENYTEALITAKTITTPGFWGGPLLRAAIYGKTGQTEQGLAELEQLQQACPRFEQDHHELLRRLFYKQENYQPVLQGLVAAGFKEN